MFRRAGDGRRGKVGGGEGGMAEEWGLEEECGAGLEGIGRGEGAGGGRR